MFAAILGSIIIITLGWIVASSFSSGRVRVDRLATMPLVFVTILLGLVPPILTLGDSAINVGASMWLIGALLAIPAVSFINVSLTRIKGLAELGEDTMRSIGKLDALTAGLLTATD